MCAVVVCDAAVGGPGALRNEALRPPAARAIVAVAAASRGETCFDAAAKVASPAVDARVENVCSTEGRKWDVGMHITSVRFSVSSVQMRASAEASSVACETLRLPSCTPSRMSMW